MPYKFHDMNGFGLRSEARRGILATDAAEFRIALHRRLDALSAARPEGNAELAAIKDALDHAPFREPYH